MRPTAHVVDWSAFGPEMIREFGIENFKSIDRLDLDLGRVNVLIGENGCGKSNILEAIALGAAAAEGKVDHEFLASRGIRVPAWRYLTSAFWSDGAASDLRLTATPDGSSAIDLQFAVGASDATEGLQLVMKADQVRDLLARMIAPRRASSERRPRRQQGWGGILKGLTPDDLDRISISSRFAPHLLAASGALAPLEGFLIFSPENTALRAFQREGQILPLGINGEGLFAHLRQLQTDDVQQIDQRLRLFDWFDGLGIPGDLGPGEHRLEIRDRYLAEGGVLDQRSANEGFLFLLFYFTLFISPSTPRFFAIDNVDASLNPKLCSRLMADLVDLAKAHDKQVIVTTHNPAVLDGLDLNDPEQRLLVVSRHPDGPTRVRRVSAPQPVAGTSPVKLSEAFLRGYLGGLPKNF